MDFWFLVEPITGPSRWEMALVLVNLGLLIVAGLAWNTARSIPVSIANLELDEKKKLRAEQKSAAFAILKMEIRELLKVAKQNRDQINTVRKLYLEFESLPRARGAPAFKRKKEKREQLLDHMSRLEGFLMMLEYPKGDLLDSPSSWSLLVDRQEAEYLAAALYAMKSEAKLYKFGGDFSLASSTELYDYLEFCKNTAGGHFCVFTSALAVVERTGPFDGEESTG